MLHLPVRSSGARGILDVTNMIPARARSSERVQLDTWPTTVGGVDGRRLPARRRINKRPSPTIVAPGNRQGGAP